MLRRALPSLFCALALVVPASGQDVFVPRELKAQPVHSPKEHKADAKPDKSKEVVRREEPGPDAQTKPAKDSVTSSDSAKTKTAKNETAPVKTDKPAPPKEKIAATKTAPPADDMVTIKVEKQAAAKEPPSMKSVAKTEPAKEKKAPASSKEKADSDLPTIKVEKASVSKEQPAAKTVAKTEPAKEKTEKPAPAKKETTVAKSEKAPAKPEPTNEKTEKPAPAKDDAKVAKSDKAKAKDEPVKKTASKTENLKVETVTTKADKPVVNDKPATVAASSSLKEDKSAKKEPVSVAKTEKTDKAQKEKEKLPVIAAKPPATKTEAMIAKIDPAPPREGPKTEIVSVPSQKDPAQIMPASNSLDTGFTRIADGFDFPVGKPEAEGYYKARGFRPGGHVGEDWDGVRGGDTDLGDPIYCIGNGIVVFARDVHLGWGNVIIVRHAYREGGNVKYIDSLYGHLNSMLVKRGQTVARGQQIATMGTAHGQYDAHLHFEIRKNLEIGMSRSKFQKDFSNYYSPTAFIDSHRHLSGGGANYKVAMNTFTHDWMFHFDSNRNFGPRKRSISESSAALRRATSSTH